MHIVNRFILGIFLFPLCIGSVSGQELKKIGSESDQLAAFYWKKVQELQDHQIWEAVKYADSLEQLARKLQNRGLLYDAFKFKGDAYRKVGDYDQAFFWLQNAFTLARDQQDTLGMVKAYNNLGAVFQNTGALDKALENYLKANVLGENHLNSAQKSNVLLNIGLVHEELNHLKEALSFYLQALNLLEKENNKKSLAFVHTNLGSLYSKVNNRDKAIEHLKLARKIFEELGNEIGIAEVLNDFSLVYMADNPEITIEYLDLAEKIYNKYRHRAGLFQTHKNAGQAYVNLKEYNLALEHLRKAQQYSDTLQNDFYKRDIYLKLAHLHELQQKYFEATEFYQKYVVLNDSLDSNKLLRNLVKTQAGFELDQKDQKIQQLEQQAAKNFSQLRLIRLVSWFMVGLVFLLVAFVIFLIIKYRKIIHLNALLKHRNRLIQSQKDEIRQEHKLINSRKTDLEKARKTSEEYFQELLEVKDQLEEKVNNRTRELEETYKKLSFHINNTSIAIVEWNSRLELTQWPKQAEIIFGYTAEEVLGLRLDEVPFVQNEDRGEFMALVDQLIQGQLGRHYVTKKSRSRFGEPLFVEWSFSVLLNSKGELESLLSMANDVTLREQTYRELKDANQELDTFLYKSSHDLRGPIARMQGIINLGLLESNDKEAHLYFNMLNKVTDELNNLLLRLLMIHNINQHEYKVEELPFAAFVNKIIANYVRKKVSHQEVMIINNVPKDLVVCSDGTLLGIILLNLLENGEMFADNFKPVIEIEALYLPSGKYVISITDNGMGVPHEFKEKVFDMFFQGSTRSTGTGLGLYMVRKATKKLGGEIQLLSGKGKTQFEITLPAEKAKHTAKVTVLN